MAPWPTWHIDWLPDRRGRLQPVLRKHEKHAPQKQPKQEQFRIPTELRHLNTWDNEERRARGERVPHNDGIKNLIALFRRKTKGG